MNNTENYEKLVSELHASYGELDCAKLDVDELQQSIFKATLNLEQEPAADVVSIKNGYSFRSLFLSSAFITGAALIGLVVVNVEMLSKPTVSTSVLAMDEADLTFQELWLSEDEMLFSSDL